MRSNQLILIDTTTASDFRIDDRTRDIGRQGIAAARQALAANAPGRKAA
jgi:hypothetical protein